MFAGFHSRTRQNDAADALIQKCRNRHRHREISLAGACRADAECEVVVVDGVDVAALVYGFRRENFLAEGARLAAFHQPAKRDHPGR